MLGADAVGEPPVRLLREHPQRARVDAAARLGELLERGVRLPGVGRAEMRHDAVGLVCARGQRDLDAALGLPDHRRGLPALGAVGAATAASGGREEDGVRASAHGIAQGSGFSLTPS